MPQDIVPSLGETRLYETVRLIREWIERSFEPSQEERFRKHGKLMARFDVDLGSNMREQLENYIKASFVLSKLQIRFTSRDHGNTQKPCVEVLLNESARSLYAEKYPQCIAKNRAAPKPIESASVPLPLPSSTAEGKEMAVLKGSERSSDLTSTSALDVKASSRQTQANPNSSPWEVVEPMLLIRGVQGAQEAKDVLDTCLAAQGPDANSRAHPKALKAQKTVVACLKGLADFEATEQCLRETRIGHAVSAWRKEKDEYISSLALKVIRKWKAPFNLEQPAPNPIVSPSTPAPNQSKRKAEPDTESPPANKRARLKQEDDSEFVAVESGQWVLAKRIGSRMDDLRQAKDVLEACLANQNSDLSGKIQREAVAWLKGLEDVEITVQHLRETRIGTIVNKWGKDKEPFVSRIASRLVDKWRNMATKKLSA